MEVVNNHHKALTMPLLVLVLLVLPTLVLLGGCGSKNWQRVRSGTREDLSDIAFANPRDGWAVGDNGAIVATRDGGTSWNIEQSSTLGEVLTAVHFVDNRHGWIVGWNGTILTTSDGGAQWHRQNSGTSANLIDVDFVDARHGWITTVDGTLLATADGGRRWRQLPIDAPGEVIGQVVFTGQQEGWIVGSPSVGNATSSTTVLHSTDGGIHWSVEKSGLPAGSGMASFAGARHAWLCTDRGIYATADGGVDWSFQKVPGSGCYAVSFADDRHGWVVGSDGLIADTNDGGKTWTAHDLGAFTDLNAVAALGPSRAWAVGSSGTLLRLF